MRKLTPAIVFAILLSASAVALAQDPPPGVVIGPGDTDFMKWDTFGNGDDEFHARFPKLPSVFLTRRDLNDVTGPHTGRIYAAFEEGVVCIVVVFNNPKKVPPLDQFVSEAQSRFFPSWEMKLDYEVTVNSDNGKHYLLKRGSSVGGARFFVKPKHSYIFAAVADRADHPGVKRFLDFITMWDYSYETLKESHKRAREAQAEGRDMRATDANPSAKKIKDDEELMPHIRRIDTPKAGASGLHPAASGSSSEANGSAEEAPSNNSPGYYDQVFESGQTTTGAVVVLKPEGLYTEEARNNSIEGVVRLSGVLTRDGRVKNISIIEGLPYGLTDNAINAMRHLIFLPARKDDHYIAQKITVDYTFTLK